MNIKLSLKHNNHIIIVIIIIIIIIIIVKKLFKRGRLSFIVCLFDGV